MKLTAPALPQVFSHTILDGYDFVSDPSISLDGDGRDSVWTDPGEKVHWDSIVRCECD